jgi:hypothetical protein
MDIITKMDKNMVTTHEITSESPIGVNSNGERGRKIIRYLTTKVTPNHKDPLYWINQIDYLWVPEHDLP